jgi:PAS domain S-box-containing protein
MAATLNRVTRNTTADGLNPLSVLQQSIADLLEAPFQHRSNGRLFRLAIVALLAIAMLSNSIAADALVITLGIVCLAALYNRARGITLRESRAAQRRAELRERRSEQMAIRQAIFVATERRLRDCQDGELRSELERAIGFAAHCTLAQRTAIWLSDQSSASASMCCGWSEDGVAAHVHEELCTALHSGLFSGRIQEGRVVAVEDVSSLSNETACERVLLQSQGIRSILVIPARVGSATVGFQVFVRLRSKAAWNQDEIERLRPVVDAFAGAVIHKNSIRALRESEEKLARAFDSNPDSIFIARCDDTTIVECNQGFVQLGSIGSREAVIGQKLSALDLEIDLEKLEHLVHYPTDRNQPEQVELQLFSQRRSPRTLLVSSSATEIKGRPCALVTARDVTQLKDLETRLHQSEKMEAVDRLAGGIAHGFNNMLTVISGYGEELLSKTQGDTKQSVEEICAAARRSADLTRELLAFSRLQLLAPEETDPNALVEEVKSMLGRVIGEGITIRLDLEPQPGWMRVDPGKIQQAIVNLATNARDAMPSGGTLTLETRAVNFPAAWQPKEGLGLQAGGYIRIAVRDDGVGMDHETATRALEPFFSSRESEGSAGLGLSITDGIARQSGGALLLHSLRGRGTTAEIYLPRFEPLNQAAVPLRSEPRSPTSMRTILLVEDEAMLRQLTRKFLESDGYQVIEAVNGVEAVEVSRQHVGAIDLLLSDIVMPHMNGIELSKQLRQERPETRILFMSGYPGRHQSSGSYLPPDIPLLTKPFRSSDLHAQISQILEGEHVAALATPPV